jgi:hypothetical protein
LIIPFLLSSKGEKVNNNDIFWQIKKIPHFCEVLRGNGGFSSSVKNVYTILAITVLFKRKIW